MDHQEFVNMLMDMGFSKEKAERGVAMTGNKGVEAAMEWIFSHSNEFEPGTSKESIPNESSNVGETGNDESSAAGSSSEVAKSLRCDDCGKLFSSQAQIEFHVGKSGHTNFSESTEEKKPLTEEEKQEQLRKIEEKLKEKRKEREEKEKVEEIEKEKRRIRSGREMTDAKRRMEELEMKKLIEARKREKEEEKQARLRVKKLIEADKLARKGLTNVSEETVKPPVPVECSKTKQEETPKNYTETKIQIRLLNGETLTQTFDVNEELNAVRLYVELNRTDGDLGPFRLMTNFPKKVFAPDEYCLRLKDLGLVPRAVIIVTKG